MLRRGNAGLSDRLAQWHLLLVRSASTSRKNRRGGDDDRLAFGGGDVPGGCYRVLGRGSGWLVGEPGLETTVFVVLGAAFLVLTLNTWSKKDETGTTGDSSR